MLDLRGRGGGFSGLQGGMAGVQSLWAAWPGHRCPMRDMPGREIWAQQRETPQSPRRLPGWGELSPLRSSKSLTVAGAQVMAHRVPSTAHAVHLHSVAKPSPSHLGLVAPRRPL